MAFTSFAALAIVYRLVLEEHASDPAWMLLPLSVATPVLFALFYPRPPA